MTSPSEAGAVRVRVLLFAGLRELAGRGELEVEIPPGATVADLRRAVAAVCPELAGAAWSLAQDTVWCREEDPVDPQAELALLPPVSGG